MADNKDEEKDNKKTKRTTKIEYRRCSVCGVRKRVEDMMTSSRGLCKECFDKQLKQPGVFTKASNKYEHVCQKKNLAKTINETDMNDRTT